MMIANNICFSTIMGKISASRVDVDTDDRLGVIGYPEAFTAEAVYTHYAEGYGDPILISNGSLFCSREQKAGLLPRILEEMLSLRQMIKRVMKEYKSKPECAVLCRVLEARQLAIKLLANVTYGYTGAGFSGRMPMAEVADAIVQSGRDTLKWSINEITRDPIWKATVEYGDTDSMFISLVGRSKEEAFKIGEDIVQRITEKSPPAVVLKLEKVYLPCITVTMKRYVGWSFESSRGSPHFDAKGIEIVRRDTCAAVAKVQEQALRILFESRDLSAVKAYLTKQWLKLLRGGPYLNSSDFIFAKEVRLGTYRGTGPPGAIVAKRRMDLDPNAEVPYNWRVPYVVVTGSAGGGCRLIDLVVPPEDLLSRGSGLSLNIKYYIEKCINPAVDRLFSLCSVNIASWYRDLPRPSSRLRKVTYGNGKKAVVSTIDTFFLNKLCEFCGKASKNTICSECLYDKRQSYAFIMYSLKNRQSMEQNLSTICLNCANHFQPILPLQQGELLGPECCSSIDCSLFHKRYRLMLKIEDLQYILNNMEW